MLIRRETATDHDAIDAVHRAAFATEAGDDEPMEVGLVHELRVDIGWVPALSLVAEDATRTVVGQTLDIASPDPAWGASFQARQLSGWSDECGGRFRYAAPFDRLS